MKRQEIKKYFHGAEPWLNIFILSPITVTITQLWLKHVKRGPDAITTCSLIAGVIAGIFYGFGEVTLGSIFYFFSYLCDAVDGKIARITAHKSRYGAWFDIFVDRTVFAACVLGLSVGTLSGIEQVIIPVALIFLFQLGFESRYNIQFHKVKASIDAERFDELRHWHAARDDKVPDMRGVSAYRKWTIQKGVIMSPVSLVEIMFLLFIFAPLTELFEQAAYFTIIVLGLRLTYQQRYWLFK